MYNVSHEPLILRIVTHMADIKNIALIDYFQLMVRDREICGVEQYRIEILDVSITKPIKVVRMSPIQDHFIWA